MDQEIEELLEKVDTATLTTIDSRGFPHVIAVSKPLERGGFHYFKFYINQDGRTAENIRANRNGSLFFVDPENHESLALKGFFLLEEIEGYEAVTAKLNDFQQSLEYKHPVLAVFETLSVKHYKNQQTEIVEG
ncbi:pyridoxamine 5'-phosphate oxidase family protein [Enterococcus sp. 669A]|uniref:Pyridoxamine 5'-phosphate oxidase family protein n=1 Tax=Candidatus Enterococcus moelleringii TaxID=2815325 RepID=A0ABS3L970_9ENTE|nr:pyridoxamine 5'-phosphate oxidase family protein [Enterococcus sp. 669A]MBO1306194.1 pyridoxamine 5'-phosphate oxidase family protein [Enterococcus sp. 669A]